jgi:hypothetical protein
VLYKVVVVTRKEEKTERRKRWSNDGEDKGEDKKNAII